MRWRALATAAVIAALMVLALTGCGISRGDAAKQANDTCAARGSGVSKFWYDGEHDDTYEFGCKDGYYEGHGD